MRSSPVRRALVRHSSHRLFYEDYLYPVSLSLQAAKMADEESSSEQKTLIAEEQKNSCVSLRVEETKPIFQVHNFSEQLSDQVVHFQVLKMVDSLILWIGLKPEMSNLSVAACTKFDDVPAVASLLGASVHLGTNTLAQKLAKKTGKQCFVSCNIPPSDSNMLMTLVETRINKERRDCPEKF